MFEGRHNRAERVRRIEIAMDFQIDIDAMLMAVCGDFADAVGDALYGLRFLRRIRNVVAENAHGGNLHLFENVDGLLRLFDDLRDFCRVMETEG